nr:hypothetical protein [Tanacetum cinerariifolium]
LSGNVRTAGSVLYTYLLFWDPDMPLRSVDFKLSILQNVIHAFLVWIDGKDFPRDSSVDGFDGDMTLETLLNDNPTRFRRVFIKVLNPIDVVCGEEKLEETERPVLERTADVVTQSSDQVISLVDAIANQMMHIADLPHVFDTTKKVVMETPTSEYASKK